MKSAGISEPSAWEGISSVTSTLTGCWARKRVAARLMAVVARNPRRLMLLVILLNTSVRILNARRDGSEGKVGIRISLRGTFYFVAAIPAIWEYACEPSGRKVAWCSWKGGGDFVVSSRER